MKHLKTSLLAILLVSSAAFAQTKTKAKAKPQAQQPVKITVPMFNDAYTKYVKHLEEGNVQGIDFAEFRASYLYSEQFKVASEKSQEYNRLKTLLAEQTEKQKFTDVITTAKQMLSIDYTSLVALRALSNAYAETGDAKNSAKYASIQNGLLQSIITRGNGSTCQTAWPVIQEEEEYFVLETIGAGVVASSIYRTGGVCDEIQAMKNGKKTNYYFETTRLEEGKKMLTPVQE